MRQAHEHPGLFTHTHIHTYQKSPETNSLEYVNTNVSTTDLHTSQKKAAETYESRTKLSIS